MPLPSKKDNESKENFISRCMNDENLINEFADLDQRLAVCMSKACDGLSMIEHASFKYACEEYGFTEELTEDNWYCPTEAEYETDIEWNEPTEEWDISEAKPGLWENIRKKKEREGKKYKPAKKGDKDRPDPDAWKKAQSEDDFKPHTMYDKDGKPHEAKTYEDHLRMKKQGYTHVPARAAEYQGRKVKLGKPFLTPDGPKKRSVYVKNDKGNVVKVNFGDPNMTIKKSDPARRKSFRARHNCDNPGPRWKPRYWSCRAWVLLPFIMLVVI